MYPGIVGPENIITPPHRRDWNFFFFFCGGGGVGVAGPARLNILNCTKLNWNFQRGGGS